MSNQIRSRFQALHGESVVELFELDGGPLGIGKFYFHGHEGDGIITWQGIDYIPWGIKAEGFQRRAEGTQPRPTLTLANVGIDPNKKVMQSGVISRLCLAADDFVGMEVTRHRTLVRYLDAKNFPDGNPTADPTEEAPLEIWVIERKTQENLEVVVFELTTFLDLGDMQLPLRVIDNEFYLGAKNEIK